MKYIKRMILLIISILLIMLTCLAIDYSRVRTKKNPLFSFFRLYDIQDELYPYNKYYGPFYHLKIENRTGTRSDIDIHESTRVEMGLWFKDSELVFEQEFTYQ